MERYRLEYLHSESSHWQTAGGFESPEEALRWVQTPSKRFEEDCEEIQLWDDSRLDDSTYRGPLEYNFDTREWD